MYMYIHTHIHTRNFAEDAVSAAAAVTKCTVTKMSKENPGPSEDAVEAHTHKNTF